MWSQVPEHRHSVRRSFGAQLLRFGVADEIIGNACRDKLVALNHVGGWVGRWEWSMAMAGGVAHGHEP